MTTSSDPADQPATGARAMDALRRVVQALTSSARTSAHADAPSGAQIFLLRQLVAAPGLSVGELAERALARQSTVSEAVSRLVERGLVAREPSPTDARRVALTATAAGRRMAACTADTVQERLVAGLAAMPDARRAELATLLEEWLVAAGLVDEAAPVLFLEAGGREDGRPGSNAAVTRGAR